MKDFVFQNCTLADMPHVARKIILAFPDERIFALFGELGAGKTTLIKDFCDVLKVNDEVTSPSFSIVNEYEAGGIDLIYHFDFYRIKKLEEAYDLGYEDYIYSGNYCFIEWPEMIESLLPEGIVAVSIKEADNGARQVEARKM